MTDSLSGDVLSRETAETDNRVEGLCNCSVFALDMSDYNTCIQRGISPVITCFEFLMLPGKAAVSYSFHWNSFC